MVFEIVEWSYRFHYHPSQSGGPKDSRSYHRRGLQKVQLKKPIELAGVTIEGIVNTYTTSAGAAPGFLRGLMANETVSLTVRKEEGGIPVLKEQLIDDIVTDSDLTEKEVRDGLNALNNMDGEPTVTVKYRE